MPSVSGLRRRVVREVRMARPRRAKPVSKKGPSGDAGRTSRTRCLRPYVGRTPGGDGPFIRGLIFLSSAGGQGSPGQGSRFRPALNIRERDFRSYKATAPHPHQHAADAPPGVETRLMYLFCSHMSSLFSDELSYFILADRCCRELDRSSSERSRIRPALSRWRQGRYCSDATSSFGRGGRSAFG